jgi:hypothetical protein
LRVCLNCKFHDRQAAYQCSERRAEPVSEKDADNFCEYFDFQVREWRGAASSGGSREDQARAELKRLFGDD